jgi:histidinol-phosphate aminotransferase
MNSPIRSAVRSSPDYPFVPVEAAVKLDQNEGADDLPEALKARVLERLAREPWHRYPDLNAEALCRAIGEHAGWPASGVVVTTGSNVLIALLIQLAALEARVVTVTPNFALYGLDAKLLGARLTEVPLRADLSVDMAALVAALDSGARQPTGVVYLPRPHAPTGSLAPEGELERLVLASTGWLTVVDEAYHEFAGTDALALARRFPHVVLMRTFSKAWGLAGLRLGYLLASDEVARQLRKLVPPFAVSVLQTVAAQVALEHPEVMRCSVARTVAERDRVAAALRAHPTWQVFPSSANFLLIRTPDAAQAWRALLAGGVLVRRQDAQPGLEGCLRVTIGRPAENDAFLRAAGIAVG